MIDHLVLLDGTKISTETGEVVEDQANALMQQQASELLSVDPEFVGFKEGSVKRTLDDIDIDFRVLRVMFAVFSAGAWGLKPPEIARLLDAELEQIQAIIEDEKYAEVAEQIFGGLKKAMRENVDGILMDSARDAALVLRQQLTANSLDARRLSAKDILDRTGFKSADTVNLSMDDEFIIRIIEDKQNNKVIDL